MSTSCLQFSNCRVPGWHEPRRHRSTSNLSGVILERNKFALGTLYTAMQIYGGCVLICHVHLLCGLKALSSACFCDFNIFAIFICLFWSIEGPMPWIWRQMDASTMHKLPSLYIIARSWLVLHGSVPCADLCWFGSWFLKRLNIG